MPDETVEPSVKNGASTSWKLIQRTLARREFTGMDIYEVEKVSGAADGSVVISGKDSAGATVQHTVEADPAFERIATAAVQTSQQIQDLYDQTKQQAVFWFRVSAVAAVLGFGLVIGGIIAILFFQQSTVAIFSTVCGVLLNVIATLFFRQSKDANGRVDEYREDSLNARAIYQTIELIKASESIEIRDRLREMIVKKLLNIEQDP